MNCHVDSTKLSTFKIGGKIKDIIYIEDEKTILNLKELYHIVGSGSNTIFSDNLPNLTVAKIEIKGIEIIEENQKEIHIAVGAGEDWDNFVRFAVENNYSGIEALANIPGTVGAAPVQNIGAYGTEVRETIFKIRIYDRENKKFKYFSNQKCEFSYRDSIFKRNPKKWIITKVIFKLKKNAPLLLPEYKDVKNYFETKAELEINLKNIREAIIEIRKHKLPNPNTIPNCGSFFKNPIISKEAAEKLKKDFPNIPLFPFKNLIKVPAGFLIEQAGFKGKKINTITVYSHNALVLTNPNYNASFADLLSAKNMIQKSVFEKFGIKLESEVNIIQDD